MVRKVLVIDGRTVPLSQKTQTEEFQMCYVSMQNQPSPAIKEALEYCHTNSREHKIFTKLQFPRAS